MKDSSYKHFQVVRTDFGTCTNLTTTREESFYERRYFGGE